MLDNHLDFLIEFDFLARMLALGWQGTVMLLYFILVFLVYLAPLVFTCPCVMDRHRLKARPAVMGRRGAPMVGGASFAWIDQRDQTSHLHFMFHTTKAPKRC